MSSDPARLCEAVVVGGGPAGLAAATWLGRWRCSTVLVDAGEHRNRWVEATHGYLGSDGIAPGEFAARARKDLARYETVELVYGRVVGARRAEPGRFEVTTEDGTIRCQRLVLATGTRDEFPDVEGFFEHYGADVFHCPLCDGYEAEGRHVVVLGWDRGVAFVSRKLLRWAAAVTVVTEGRRFAGDEDDREALATGGIDLLERDDAIRLVGARGRLEAVELRSGRRVEAGVVFFSLPNRPVNDLASSLGCRLDGDGHVVIDREGRTSEDGIFAAGDVTPGRQLIQVAAAQGAMAGLACAASLSPAREEP